MGRPKNKAFEELGFELSKVDNKYAAVCSQCNKRLINTSERRLRAHRNICKRPNPVNPADFLQQLKTNPDETIYTILDEVKHDQNEAFYDDLSSESDPLSAMDTELSNDDVTKEIFPKPMYTTVSNENIFAFPRLYESAGCSKQFRFSSTSCSGSTSPLSAVSPANSKNVKSKSFPEFVDKLSDKEEDELNEALSKLIFGCNLPCNLVDSVYFRNFIGKIRPAYAQKVPNRKTLMTTLLDNAYMKCISTGMRSMSKNSVLLIDGWKNCPGTTKNIVSILYNTNGEKIFLQMWEFGNCELTEQFYDIVSKSLDIAKEIYLTNVYAVVSDNTRAVNEPMGKHTQQLVWHSNCSNHNANLFAKEMLNKTLTDNVITVLKEFKQPDFENCIIEKGGTRIRLPYATRWCSYRDSYQCLVQNCTYMKCVATELEIKKIKQNVIDLIFDDQFIEDVKDNIRLFDQIYILINACKSDCSSADAVNLWLDINLPDKFEHELKYRLKTRIDAVLNKYTLAAFYLHPFYDNAKLSQAHQGVINNFLFDSLDSVGLEEWDSFRSKTSFFKKLYEKGIKKPLVFWNMAEMQHPNLSQLAIKLLQIPASSAQKQQGLSSWQKPNIPNRNGLTIERSNKLLHLYYSLRIADEIMEGDDSD